MKRTDVTLIFLLLYIHGISSVTEEQPTTAVVVWDGTSELTESSNQTDTTGADGSGEVTQAGTSPATSVSDLLNEGQNSSFTDDPLHSQLTVVDDGSGEITPQQTTVLVTKTTVFNTSPRQLTTGSRGNTESTSPPFPHPTRVADYSSTRGTHYVSVAKGDLTSTVLSEDMTTNMEIDTEVLESTLASQSAESSSPSNVDMSSASLPGPTSSSITSPKPTLTSGSTVAYTSSAFSAESSSPETVVSSSHQTHSTAVPTQTVTTATTPPSTTSVTSVAPGEETNTATSSPRLPDTSTSRSTDTTSETTLFTTTLPPDLGQPCMEPTSCSHIDHAICNNTCQCQAGFYQIANFCYNASLVTPSNVTVTLDGFITAIVTWNIPKPSDLKKILVTLNTSQVPLTLNPNNRTVILSLLQYDTSYQVTVTAVLQDRTVFSSLTDFTTPSGQVQNIRARVINASVQVSWSPVMDPSRSVITYHVIFGDQTHSTTETNITVKLKYDTCYNVSISAATNVDKGPTSHVIWVTTDSGVPQRVKDLTASGILPDRAQVSWRSPEITNGRIVAYYITVTEARNPVVLARNLTCADCHQQCPGTTQMAADTFLGLDKFSFTQTLFNITIPKLSPFTMYRLSVIASTVNYTGQSNNISFNTTEDTPSPPVNITLVIYEKSVKVNWSRGRPRGNTNYYVRTQDQYSGKTTNTSCNGMTCNVTGLTPFWNYTLQVVANNSRGQVLSSAETFRTLPDKPGPVRNLSVEQSNDVTTMTSLTVTWNPPSLRERNGVIKHYRVQASCGKYTTDEETTTEQIKLKENIEPECQYNITVNAATKRGDGTGVWKIIWTLAGAPLSSQLMAVKSQMAVADPVHQLSLQIPGDLLCDRSRGKIRFWGVVVLLARAPNYRPPYRGPRSEYPVQSSEVAVNRSASDTCRNIDVVIGDSCNDRICYHALDPDTGYRFVVFVCTSTGCTETNPSQIFYTEREESNTVIIGVVSGVLLIVLSCLLAAVLFKLWKKWKSVRPSVHFDAATIELGTKKSSLVSESQKSRPVKLQNFADQVEYLHRDSNLGFSEEYKVLKQLSPKHPTKAAEQQACRTKNRYTNVLPFDHSRVKLLSQDDEEGSDYINANFVTGYTCKREYIAAQGPLPCTKDDFWRLIWEHRVGMVVMLTQCKERGRIKCEKYWPDNTDPVYFGDLIVQLRSESVLPDYVIRILDVKQGNKKRVVRHFHFLKWPDFGCPEKTWLLLNFVSAVRAHMPHHQEGPTLVHCSAGVGRTGTFIAVDYLLQEIKEYSEVDIFGLVLQMRENRPLMVQTENQYIYIHDCIRDALQEDTDEEGSLEEEEEEEEEPVYQNC